MLQKMMKAVSLKYTRTKTVTIETTSSKLLDLIRNEPILFLDAIMGIKVEETLKEFKAGDEFGEWTVVEKLTIPLVPTTKFKTKFTPKDNGSHWMVWASCGITVESTYTVDGASAPIKPTDGESPDEEAKTSQFNEVATLSCPFFVYPLVRWQFNTNHEKNLVALQQHFKPSST